MISIIQGVFFNWSFPKGRTSPKLSLSSPTGPPLVLPKKLKFMDQTWGRTSLKKHTLYVRRQIRLVFKTGDLFILSSCKKVDQIVFKMGNLFILSSFKKLTIGAKTTDQKCSTNASAQIIFIVNNAHKVINNLNTALYFLLGTQMFNSTIIHFLPGVFIFTYFSRNY